MLHRSFSVCCFHCSELERKILGHFLLQELTFSTVCVKVEWGDDMIEITAARHAYPEPAGFCMDRKSGYREAYTFLHFHNSMELVCGGERLTTQPHGVILYEPDVPQYFKSDGLLVHDWMHFRGDISRLSQEAGLPLNAVCYPANPTFITRVMAEIESELFGGRPNYARLLGLKAEELLIKVGRALTEQEAEPQSPAMLERFRTLRGEMFMSLEEPWCVRRMADRVFLSESRFHALYKRFFGVSPTTDLINARMNSARNMLTLQSKSVEEIAAMLGYQNTTHFIRQFKTHNGVTPVKYRREHAE